MSTTAQVTFVDLSFTRPDYLVLDGIRSPGVVTVSGGALKRQWDKRKGYGTTGATLVYTGDDLSDFDATFTFWQWDDGQRDEWLAFAKAVLVKPPTAKGAKTVSPKAQRIEYWQLNDPPVSITSVVVVDVGQPDTSDETGLVTVKVKFSQYRAPSAALGKPKGTNVPAVKKKPPTAQDQQDLQIQALMKQLQTEVAK